MKDGRDEASSPFHYSAEGLAWRPATLFCYPF
jgi:hypothetical protein